MRLKLRRFLFTPIFGLPFLFTSVNAHAQSYGTNIVVNGDAESGAGNTDGDTQEPVPGWSKTGQFTVVQYGASGGFPDKTSPGPTDRGLNFFAGGDNAPVSTASQTIHFAPDAEAIDSGVATYTLSGYFGGFADQGDHTSLTAVFEDANGKTLKTVYLGPVLKTDRKSITGLFLRSTHGLVMTGARSIVLTLTMTRNDGAYNDGSADNISLVLD